MRYRRSDERGVALITILLSLSTLMVLSLAAMQYGMGSLTVTKRDQNWHSALSASEGGIDDYLFRLNENSSYTSYSATTPPPDGNRAFSQYTAIPGGNTAGSYQYSADTSRLTADGTIGLTVTGQVGASKRTVQTTLRRRNFLDYLYFTDYETADPATYTGSPFTAAQAQTTCTKHYYEARDSRCTDITFVSADTVNGPLHSNDAIKMCGTPRFAGATSTSWQPASGNRWRDGCPTSRPTFTTSGDPTYRGALSMPPSNSALRAQTTSAAGGCLYTGPTRIRLLATGQMTVRSPFSRQTNNSCPTNGTGNLPRNGVIFVQNVPSATTDANYTSGCPYSVNSRAHPLGLPITNDLTPYGCRDGDVFIEGTLKGQLTVASDNNIDVTWHLTYNGGTGGSDLLGLVANNFVEIWHPIRCASGTTSSCNLNANFPSETARNARFTNPNIHAAILAVNHSFRTQNWTIGSSLGTLNATGVIAQRFRGAVGTSNGATVLTGLAKNYVYDQRLKYQSPPKFLDPVASAWALVAWKEIPVPAGM